MAFLGRLSPEKGVEQAIAIAQQVGMPLKIAAKVDPKDREYFQGGGAAASAPDLSGRIYWRGWGRPQGCLLGEASALLFPIDWPEPFGLVMIEAMACGTPVIAYPAGRCPKCSRMASPGGWWRALKRPCRRSNGCPCSVAPAAARSSRSAFPPPAWSTTMSSSTGSTRTAGRSCGGMNALLPQARDAQQSVRSAHALVVGAWTHPLRGAGLHGQAARGVAPVGPPARKRRPDLIAVRAVVPSSVPWDVCSWHWVVKRTKKPRCGQTSSTHRRRGEPSKRTSSFIDSENRRKKRHIDFFLT